MAAAPIILGAVAGCGVGYAAAGALALGTVGTAVATATGAVVGASLMTPDYPTSQAMETSADVPVVDTPETDPTPVDTTSETGGADTTINDVVAVQEDVATQADTTADTTEYTAPTSVGTAAGGAATATAASAVSTGPAEDEAIDFYEKGRRSTILTTPQGIVDKVGGLLSENGSSILRPRRGLLA